MVGYKENNTEFETVVKNNYCTHNPLNPLTQRAIKIDFIFLKRPEKTKIIKKEVEDSNRP
jgi:hypothetical protein